MVNDRTNKCNEQNTVTLLNYLFLISTAVLKVGGVQLNTLHLVI